MKKVKTTFEKWGEKRPVDVVHDALSLYADWKAEREKLIGTLEWAINHIVFHQHYYFLNISTANKRALEQARAVLAEVKEKS